MSVFVVNNIKLYFISVCFLTSCKISFEFFLLPWLQSYLITCINVSYMNLNEKLKKLYNFFNLFFYDKLHFMNCRAQYADITYVINIIISVVKCNVIERHRTSFLATFENAAIKRNTFLDNISYNTDHIVLSNIQLYVIPHFRGQGIRWR